MTQQTHILYVFAHSHDLGRWTAAFMVGPTCIVKPAAAIVEVKDTFFYGRVVVNRMDFDKLRGRRFDAIIEGESFRFAPRIPGWDEFARVHLLGAK